MKIRLITTLFCIALLLNNSPLLAISKPNPAAHSAILLDAASGKVLYSKNAWTIMAPASTTKIMTAIITLERMNLNTTVSIPSVAAAKEGSSMHLAKQEKKTVRELLYGLMLVSGNDAATALAIAVSGSEVKFAQLMNEKARQLGMKNTNFKNASGLPAINHYSTAYDMAILSKYAMKNGNFAKIVSTKVKEVSSVKPGANRRLINHNKLLWRYQYTTGIKTGYTKKAGGCLVSTASRNGKKLIAVVLKSSYIYDDSQKLFSYGFSNTNSNTKLASTKNARPSGT